MSAPSRATNARTPVFSSSRPGVAESEPACPASPSSSRPRRTARVESLSSHCRTLRISSRKSSIAWTDRSRVTASHSRLSLALRSAHSLEAGCRSCDRKLPGHQGGAAKDANGPQQVVGRRRRLSRHHRLQAVERLACLEGEEVGARERIIHADKVSRRRTVHQQSHLPNRLLHPDHHRPAHDAVPDVQLLDLRDSHDRPTLRYVSP